jgi:hypothetical protein
MNIKNWFNQLFKDSNDINEKSVAGFAAFFMMCVTLITDIVTGVLGKTMPIHEFVFNGFLITALGCFGIASADKYINKIKGTKEDEEPKSE